MRLRSVHFSPALLASIVLCTAAPNTSAQTTAQAPSAATAVTPSPNLAGIAHAAFRVSDLQASLAFYKKLGFERAFELTTKDGRPSEEFIKINDRQFIELYPASLAPTEPLGLMHICYEANDLAAVQAAYQQAGLNPPAVKKAGAGNLLLVLRGPGNVVIEYTQYMPGSMHTRDQGQHLGPERIATSLIGVEEPVETPSAFADLFTTKLHFVPRPATQPPALSLPGAPSAFVAFVPTSDKPAATLILTGLSPRLTELLHDNGVTSTRRGHDLAISDPDGNHIVLRP